jgi:hypothetical protein
LGIYRGPGGTGDAVNDASSEAVLTVQAKEAAIAAQVAAEAAQAAAETAETNAETAEANAETAQSAAETAKTAAELAETNAETAEANAETAQANAETAQAAAETAQAASEASALAASDYADAASVSQIAAAASESGASDYALAASDYADAASVSQIAAASSASDTATLYDNFDDRYLGAKTSAPTVDNDGNTLLTGALYFNSSTSLMKVWSGSAWLDAYASLSGAVTSVSATAPIQSSGGTAPTVSITQATTSTNGYVSSTDWNTFNGKQASLVSGTNIKTVGSQSLLGSGDVTFSSISPITTTGDIIIGTATNTSSRLGAGASGYLLTSNGAGTAPSWQAAPVSLPTQTGNSGKFLKTDGTTASWNTLPTVLPVLNRAGSSVSVSVGNGLLPVINRAGSTVNVAVN